MRNFADGSRAPPLTRAPVIDARRPSRALDLLAIYARAVVSALARLRAHAGCPAAPIRAHAVSIRSIWHPPRRKLRTVRAPRLAESDARAPPLLSRNHHGAGGGPAHDDVAVRRAVRLPSRRPRARVFRRNPRARRPALPSAAFPRRVTRRLRSPRVVPRAMADRLSRRAPRPGRTRERRATRREPILRRRRRDARSPPRSARSTPLVAAAATRSSAPPPSARSPPSPLIRTRTTTSRTRTIPSRFPASP